MMAPVDDMEAFINEVLGCCPLIRAIWLVSDPVVEKRTPPGHFTWDLIALADGFTLQRLRKTVKLHRSDVRLRVLSVGNRLEQAWGGDHPGGVPMACDWVESRPGEGFYTESTAPRWEPGAERQRARRKALCVFQGIDPLKGPGS